MSPLRSYSLFILSTRRRVLSLGVTDDLARCLAERRRGVPGSAHLVYFEVFSELRTAAARKEQLEGWSRSRRLRMIRSVNPDLRDLSQAYKPRSLPDARFSESRDGLLSPHSSEPCLTSQPSASTSTTWNGRSPSTRASSDSA